MQSRIEGATYRSVKSLGCGRENGIIVAPVAGLRRFLPIKELWKQKQVEINLGQEIDLDALLHTLHHIGYERSRW
ncbi:hypothetical protein [Bacillus thuringiensis]|uniref:hypothetical protein n=1 Tax=Bacillus thuringiensis TaxID=1428 RepID=UPI00399B3847